MNYLIYILFTLQFTGLHDLPLANFTLQLDDVHAELEIVIDKEDLRKALSKSNDTIVESIIYDYLQSHFVVTIDNYPQEIRYTRVVYGREHSVIKGEISFDAKPNIIHIQNTVLLSTVRNQYNNVFIYYQDDTRGYLMNKDRKDIICHLSGK